MSDFEHIVVTTDLTEIEAACERAAVAVNGGRKRKRLEWPPEDHAAFHAALRSEPEGLRQWRLGQRTGEGQPVVFVAWWTDRIGRRHARVVGQRAHSVLLLWGCIVWP